MTRMQAGICSLGLVLLLASVTGMVAVRGDYYSKKFTGLPGGSNGATSVVAFGWTSQKISVQTPSGNTADVCISWSAVTMARSYNNATCPVANTAATTDQGFDRIPPGTLMLIDDMEIPGVTLIGDTAGQTITIRAWRK